MPNAVIGSSFGSAITHGYYLAIWRCLSSHRSKLPRPLPLSLLAKQATMRHMAMISSISLKGEDFFAAGQIPHTVRVPGPQAVRA
jgi:hypothetical protein